MKIVNTRDLMVKVIITPWMVYCMYIIIDDQIKKFKNK